MCYIQQFVDHDPSTDASDFTCGSLSYDGHKGTDFGLPTLAAQHAGVDVLAAAPGTVLGVRNDMSDILQDSPDAPDVTGRECGNGVVISHGDGWETQYCHLAQGSVSVQPGQAVAAGQVLGRIGLSGQTEFPHLHLSVRKDGAVIDPFDPDGNITCAAPSTNSLWTTPLHWSPTAFIDVGFSSFVPEYAAIKAGDAHNTILAASDPIVLFGLAFGGQSEDQITFTIQNPDGDIIHQQNMTLDRQQAQYFRASGRRAPALGWPSGTYLGEIVLIRAGVVIDRTTANVSVE
ncbi:M23 family metallopeptidase [Aestuariibius sp. HNIBRBA575]|uniref:M23 family metallopeptidase n=1 Tax=Aestuariibius sp. HNIBRBA575 TaxID=3233343 RepID=UPI0034A4C9C0